MGSRVQWQNEGHSEARLMTDERWHHIMRIVNEAFENSETRTVALRKRIVAGVKRT